MSHRQRASACALLLASFALPLAAGAASPTYPSGRFQLELDGGASAGHVKSVAGGAPKAEVVTEDAGTGLYPKKHLAEIGYTALAIESGLDMSPDFFHWIEAFTRGEDRPRNGAVVEADLDGKATSRREFSDATITSLSFPALDASSTEPATMDVTAVPAHVEYTKGAAQRSAEQLSGQHSLSSSFRVDISGLPCDRIARVESFGWRRVDPKAPLEVSNLVLSIGAEDVRAWRDWYEDFVVYGASSDADELEGLIVLLDSDGRALAEIDLLNIGILSLEVGKMEAGGETVSRFEVELYVERMVFNYVGDES